MSEVKIPEAHGNYSTQVSPCIARREDVGSRLNEAITSAAGTINPDDTPFQMVQLVWRNITKTSAECCIDPDGEVNVYQAMSHY